MIPKNGLKHAASSYKLFSLQLLRSNKAKSRYIEESVIGEYRATEKPVHEQTDEEERPDLEVGEGYGHLDNNEAVDTSPKEEPKSFIVNEGAMYEESTFHGKVPYLVIYVY